MNLKRIKLDGVDVALDKANHYRLLNEPLHAESICLDVIAVDPQNQRAIVTLLLALTDQFPTRLHSAHQHAESLIPQLTSEYDKLYYEGIIHERWASSNIQNDTASLSVPVWLSKAMQCYELAEKLSNGANPDPILRWNTCARLHATLPTNQSERSSLMRDIQNEFGDDVPLH